MATKMSFKKDLLTWVLFSLVGLGSLGLFSTAAPMAETGIIPLKTDSCNAVAHAQIPGTTNWFIGRHYFHDSDGTLNNESCNPQFDQTNHTGLVLEKLNWNGHQFQTVKPLLPVPFTISGGPLKGATIRAAYDPSIIRFHNQYWVTFECGLVDGRPYGVRGASACMAPYNFNAQQINPNKIYVVVSGKLNPDKTIYSASVPTFLAAHDHLYLYWSAIHANVNRKSSDLGKFYTVSVYGAELVGNNGYYWVKGSNGVTYSNDPNLTTEVWAGTPNDPTRDSAVGIRALWMHNDSIIALADFGGGECTKPVVNTPGCFRMALTRASQPLGYHIFNKGPLLDEAILPTNPQGYTRPIITPSGGYDFIGQFYYGFTNGFSERRIMPPRNDWPPNVKPGEFQVVAFPFADQQLWPTTNN